MVGKDQSGLRLSRLVLGSLLGVTLSSTLAAQTTIEQAVTEQPVTTAAEAAVQHADNLSPYALATTEEYGFLEKQIHSGESQSAQNQLNTIIQQIEATQHRYHADLTLPLTLSGDAHMKRQEYAAALELYDRARHISRVSSGLFDEGQLPIVYREATALRQVGDLKSAGQREEYAYEVAKRAFGDYDVNGLPALYRLADFYLNSSHYVAARSLYGRALVVHTSANQQDSLAAIPALQGIANSHRLIRFPPYYVSKNSEEPVAGPTPGLTTGELRNQFLAFNDFPAGERALQKIISIRQAQQPEQDQVIVQAILDLADWHLLFDRTNTANTLYTHIYTTLSERALPTHRFDQPKLIYYPRPADPELPDPQHPQPPATGHVTVGFEVSAAGHIRKLKTLESVPPGLMDFRVRRSMRIAVYRPRLIDGIAVAAEEQTHTHSFAYYPKKTEKPGDSEPQNSAPQENAPPNTKSQEEVNGDLQQTSAAAASSAATEVAEKVSPDDHQADPNRPAPEIVEG